MPLTSIVAICLRIFALNWLVYGIIAVVQLLDRSRRFDESAGNLMLLFSVLIPIVGALLIWMWSRTIARVVTPRPDSDVHLGGLTLQDLYSFAFTFLGIYFVLSSIPSMINFLHYAIVQARKEPASAQQGQYFYDLTHHVLTFIAGGVCVVLAPSVSKKLARAHSKGREQKV